MGDYSGDVNSSPRKLHEMTLPTPDAHDVTTASGVSMKQFEEQLNGLRKENFHLKLRIYFLEEKLGTGSPPAVQGLLEHNVRLQVEVEELRRQLTDKQELLAAAAEAIDVLEQQGSMSTDSVEAMDTTAQKTDSMHIDKLQNYTKDTCLESESAGDYMRKPENVEELGELKRLRRENRKALQMIKGCMKKIQQQDKEIKKLKLDKELVYAHVSDSQLEKYEEIVKCKDKHIRDLENKIKDLQQNVDNNSDVSGNLQDLLTRRLQGLAYFLDKLLSHKCVLGEDKKRLAESILEQSLAFPVGLKLDESMAPEDFTMDESNLDISQSLRLEDLTLMFGHHVHCSDDNLRVSARRLPRRPPQPPQPDAPSESECWSEPDRNVSLARIGLREAAAAAAVTSDAKGFRARRSRISQGSRSDDKVTCEAAVFEEVCTLMKQIEQLEQEKNLLNDELASAREQIKDLIAEKNTLNETLAAERANLIEANTSTAMSKQALLTVETKAKEVEQKLASALQSAEQLRSEKLELEATFTETEHSLRRAADEATVQASQAALERARAQHDRMRIERDLEETREKLSTAMETLAQVQIENAHRVAMEAGKVDEVHEGLPSEEDRPTSPDQGIDSDRLSSLEQNDGLSLSPSSLYEENVTLKQKLARTKATLADTLAQLNAANTRKRSVQRAICREIHKTQGVLRKARDHLEHPN